MSESIASRRVMSIQRDEWQCSRRSADGLEVALAARDDRAVGLWSV